jgi:hypothetical protein
MRLQKVLNANDMKSELISVAKIVIFAIDIESLDIKKSFTNQVD